MTAAPRYRPDDAECAPRAELAASQQRRFRALLAAVHGANRFYTRKLDAAGVAIDALGKLNRANVGAPNQRFSAAASAAWSRGVVLLTAMARHVGPYEDDAGGAIDSFTTVDANIRWSLGELFREGSEASIALGVANLFDEDPPLVDIAGSYDPRSADPRGRRVFLSFGLEVL